MKKKFNITTVLFILLTGVTRISQAQYVAEINEVVLTKTGSLSEGVICRETTNKILQTLGQPSGIEGYFFEMNDRNGKIYHYGSNKLYIIGDTLISFEINDPSITVSAGKSKTFKIHNKIKTEFKQGFTKNGKSSKSETSQSFIGFPVSSISGNAFNVDYKKSLLIRLENNSQLSDSSLSLLFNDQDELIHIHYTD